MNELTTEQKMAYLRKALEMGANIEIKLHNRLDKEEAIKAAKERSYHGTRWFEIHNNYKFDTTIYFEEKYVEEAM